MSCTSPPIASVRSRLAGEPELLADLHRAQRDAARVPLRVRVLVGEAHSQRAHVRAEEDVLRGDEIRAAQVAGKRPRLRGAREVDRDGDADEQDPVELDLVPDPPAELRVVHRQRRDQRGREPDEADDDHEVERALRQQERPERAQREQPVRGETRGRARRARRCCSAPAPAAAGSARRAPRRRGDHDGDQHGLQDEQRPHGRQTPRQGEGREREDHGAGGQRRAARDRDDAVRPEPDARRREAVQGEQRRHHGERRADEHRSRVRAPRAEDRQTARGARGDERAEADGVGVRLAREADRVVAERRPARRPGQRPRRRRARPRATAALSARSAPRLFRHERECPLAPIGAVAPQLPGPNSGVSAEAR